MRGDSRGSEAGAPPPGGRERDGPGGPRRPPAAATRIPLLLAGAIAALACLLPGRAQAQGRGARSVLDRGVLELRAGAASPKGDLGDVADDGQLFGVGLRYRLLPRLALGVEGVLTNLERGGDPDLLGGSAGPDVELWHYMATASLELTDPVRSRWEIVLHAGAGGTHVSGDATPTLPEVSTDEATVSASVDGGYDVSDGVTLFFRADGYMLLGSRGDPEHPYVGKEVVLTHTGGLRIGL